jgi:hypothetical protein
MRRDSQKTNFFRPVFFYFTDAQTTGNRRRSSGTKKPVLSGLDFFFHGVISQKPDYTTFFKIWINARAHARIILFLNPAL